MSEIIHTYKVFPLSTLETTVLFRVLHPGPTAHLWVPLTFSSTAGAVWSGGPGALFPAVLLPVGVGRWGRLQLGAGTEWLSWATGWEGRGGQVWEEGGAGPRV